MAKKEKHLKTKSLRTRMLTILVVLVLFQSTALVFSLFFSGLFTKLNAESFRLLDSTTAAQADICRDNMRQLAGSIEASQLELNNRLLWQMENFSASTGDFYENDTLLRRVTQNSQTVVVSLLQNLNVNSAFVIFAGSSETPEDPNAHTAVVIRNLQPSRSVTDSDTLIVETGNPQHLARPLLPFDENAQNELLFGENGQEPPEFYALPIEAAGAKPGLPASDYGCWTFSQEQDNTQAVFFSLPLLDRHGNAFGVMGVSISLEDYLTHYVPSPSGVFQDNMLAIATRPFVDNTLSGLILHTQNEQKEVPALEAIEVEPNPESTVYSATVSGLLPQYSAIHPLGLYDRTSAFRANDWTFAVFVEQTLLLQSSRSLWLPVFGSIVIITLLSIAAVVAVSFFATRQINRLPEAIRKNNPHRELSFEKTGFQEIDELTRAIESLNRSIVYNEKITSKIMNLTNMPLGCFEMSSSNPHVIVTDYVYALLRLEKGTLITQGAWKAHYKNLTSNPAPEYPNVYLYSQYNPLIEDDSTNKTLWLRIQQEETEQGYVGTIQDITEDYLRERQLAEELDYDALTKLYSRSAFKREAHAVLSNRPNLFGAMIFADLDNLKYINDTFGHDIGDQYIIKAGQMFSFFEREGGVVSRISGDEFAIYLHGFETKTQAREKIHRLFEEIGSAFIKTPDGKQHPVRSSSGIAWYPDDSDNITDLLKLSDFAMYEAKHSRKGTLNEFNRQSYSENAYLLENREAINRLIDEGMIRFAFQPILNLKTGEVFGYEALMRPLLNNFRTPSEILLVAEAQSKLGQLEKMVIFKAMQTIEEKLPQFGNKMVFVNSISSQHLDEEELAALQKRFGTVFDRIVIEITEDQNYSLPLLKKKVDSIRRMQLRLAIDDYGAGYSNEVRVLTLNPDIIKIDREIVRDIHRDADKQQLFSNIVSFCRSKGIFTIAEGIEKPEDLREVQKLGADLVQGFYTGSPNFELEPIDPDITKFIQSLH
ncbi:bifunctional diguanylate cyclase/phosphodiesterase [Ruminococcaceae bacterium OttesenSCG-928-I18]|nr:bifunctional diguanylate cyclase/phosphodiesterase [Ruminococcaceae bacterium OttesenSCG-928-I18]